MKLKNRNIVFVGACYPRPILNQYINEKNIVDIAANTFGGNIVYGMALNNVNVKVINEHKMPFFYQNNTLISRKSKFSYDHILWIDYGFVNLPIVKTLTKSIAIFLELIASNEKTIMVYSLHTAYLLPAVICAIIRKNILVLVVPDLPMYMGGKKGFIRSVLKKIDYFLQHLLLKRVDKFILISKYMISKLEGASLTNSLIIEGICDDR